MTEQNRTLQGDIQTPRAREDGPTSRDRGRTRELRGPRPIEAVELEAVLAAKADPLRQYLARRIPARLRGWITADDIMQEVWATALREFGRTRLVGERSVERWVTAIATRKLVDAIRMQRCQKRGGEWSPVDEAAHGTSSFLALFDGLGEPRTPSRAVASKEAERAVRLALAALPEDRCQAVWMRHIEGRSRGEIAAAMHKTRAAVNSLLYQGLRQLRTRLGRASRFFSDPGRKNLHGQTSTK